MGGCRIGIVETVNGSERLSQTNGRTKWKEKRCNDLLPKAPSTRRCLLQLSCAAVRHLLFSFAFSWRVDRASWNISSPGASCSANVFYIHIPFPHSKLPRTSLSLLLCPPPHMQRMQLPRTSLSLLLCPPPHMQRMQEQRRMCCCFYDGLLRTRSNLSSCTVVVNAPWNCWPDVIQKKKDKKRSKNVALDFSADFLFFIFYFVSSFLLI